MFIDARVHKQFMSTLIVSDSDSLLFGTCSTYLAHDSIGPGGGIRSARQLLQQWEQNALEARLPATAPHGRQTGHQERPLEICYSTVCNLQGKFTLKELGK